MTQRIPTEELLADLRRVADKLGNPPTTTEYQDHGEFSPTTVRNRFEGGWSEILAEAGLADSSSSYSQGGMEVGCPNCGATHQYDGDRDRFQCNSCQTTVPVWRGRIELRANNELFAALAAGPKSGRELDRAIRADERYFINRIQAPGRSKKNKSRGRTRTIYYLYGDERAAIRRFIEENREYVRGCLEDQSNPLQRNWDTALYQMLIEQWRWVQPD